VEELLFSVNVHSGSDVRQTEIHTPKSQVLGASVLEIEFAVTKLKKCKSPCSDLIPAELIQAGGD
jgi:hypothetical protein